MTDLAKRLGSVFRNESTVTAGIAKHLMLRSAPDDRSVDRLHPSEIAQSDWCPRSSYYRIIGHPVDLVPVSLAMQMVFERGHEDHRKWQNWAWEMGILGGAWSCLHCGLYWTDWSPFACPRCESGVELIRYREVPMFSEPHLLEGSADGLICWDNRVRPWEIKTVGSRTVEIEAPALVERYRYVHKDDEGKEHKGVDWAKLWRNIHRPFATHLRQGMLYLFMTGYPSMIFVYDPKFLTSHPKEFEIEFQPDIVTPLLEQCLEVKESVEKGRPPKRPGWAKEDLPLCMTCPFYATCWHLDRRPDGPSV